MLKDSSRTGNPQLPTWTTFSKLVKRKIFAFVHLGRGFDGHGHDENEGVDRSGKRNNFLEQETKNTDHPKDKGVRSFMGSVHRISLVGGHKKTNSSGGSSVHILPVLTFLSPALGGTCSPTTTNTGSSQQHTSSPTSNTHLRRALSSPTSPTSVSPRPVRSHSTSQHSRPPSFSKPTPSKSQSNSRESSQELKGSKAGLNFQQERLPSIDPSEERDATSLKNPTQSSFSTSTAILSPSPPRTAMRSHIRRQRS